MSDAVNNPSHYQNITITNNLDSYSFEAVDVIDGILKHINLPPDQSFALGNALKYILRCGKKNIVNGQDSEDLKKAEWYIHHLNQIR